ncbi:MAG: hypothetical protein V4671_30345 [Armatimonadota bacterium]
MEDTSNPPKVAYLDTVKDIAARDFAAKLRHLAEGDLGDPSTWIKAAEHFGCKVYCHDVGCLRGVHCLNNYQDGCGFIYFNPDLTDEKICRVLVHEIAHHLCCVYSPPIEADAVIRWIEIPASFSHQVAAATERYVFQTLKA